MPQVIMKLSIVLAMLLSSALFAAEEKKEESKPMNASNEVAVIKTSEGEMVVQFWTDAAPKTIENFKKLAREGFYDGTVFHRIVKGFVIQGGDPTTKNDSNKGAWGTGGPGYEINGEFNNISHARGIVSMARSADPNSAGSQFFIVLNDSKFLDNQYTVFGRVVKGMDAVDKIAALGTVQNDQPQDPDSAKINSIKIINRNATAN